MGSRKVGIGLALVALLILVGAAVYWLTGSEPEIGITDVWARPARQVTAGESDSDPRAGMGAVFMTLKNAGRESDRLLSVQTDVAYVVEIHETTLEGDVARMQQVIGGIEIPARGQVELKPGGYHVMLIGIRRDLVVRERFSITLTFEKSGDVTLQAEVRQP